MIHQLIKDPKNVALRHVSCKTVSKNDWIRCRSGMKTTFMRHYSHKRSMNVIATISTRTRSRCYKTFFMLDSTEYEFFPAYKC